MGSSTYKRDSKQAIIADINNYQLINEITFVSALPFDWFSDIFTSSHQFTGYDTSAISRSTLSNFKQTVKLSMSGYHYEKAKTL